MNTRFLITLAVSSVLVAGSLVAAEVTSKPQKGVIVGTAIELSSYAMQGADDGAADAMIARCEQGFPVGILEDETGKVWVCVYRDNAPASGMVPANKAMQAFMGKKIAAQGMKYEAQGVNVFRLSVISEY